VPPSKGTQWLLWCLELYCFVFCNILTRPTASETINNLNVFELRGPTRVSLSISVRLSPKCLERYEVKKIFRYITSLETRFTDEWNDYVRSTTDTRMQDTPTPFLRSYYQSFFFRQPTIFYHLHSTFCGCIFLCNISLSLLRNAHTRHVWNSFWLPLHCNMSAVF
jgi:hypothetical protein